MRFSIWTNFTFPWTETLATARYGAENGWYGFWYADHYMSDTPDGAPSDTGGHEVFTVLPAIAAAVPDIRLGTLVSPTTVHHPALLAKRAASLDHISGGRFTLGLGAGWQVNEHKAYGIDLLSAKDRVDRFAEALEIVASMVSQPRTTFTGRHFTITDAPCEPKPVQSPLPIMVGTKGPRMLRLTARFANTWNVWGIPSESATHAASLDRACEAVGRDPASVRRTTQALFFMVDSDATAEKIRARSLPDRTLAGSTRYLVDQVGAYAEAGFDELIIPDFTLGNTLEARLTSYERFRTEVAVHFG